MSFTNLSSTILLLFYIFVLRAWRRCTSNFFLPIGISCDDLSFFRREGKFICCHGLQFEVSRRSVVEFFFFPPCDLISGKGEGMAVKKTTISPHRPKGVAGTLSFMIPGTQR